MTTVKDVQNLVDQYLLWLKDKTSLRQLKDWVEITTPYLDRHHDYIQIYAKKEQEKILLTDDGYTLNDLEMSGCKLDSPKRKKLLDITLNGFGVSVKEDRLEVSASAENFSLRKHDLIQAILAVNDLFYLASPTVASLFFEEVTAWLELCDIRFTPKVKFTGKSGYDHLFDFVIPKSKVQPERILHTVNRPSRDTAQALAFSCYDTKDVRATDSVFYAVLNDSDREIPPGVVDALASYNVKPIKWSKRSDVQSELAA